ncbi:MAG TPA: serine hydrolase domain-containing protein [Streptosporangiaceae bacterium]|jgi:CubicO group peptidase (beta-lactamase class C family)
MTGPVTAGAQELEAALASFVKDNRLYGATAGVVHGDELAWSAGAGFADAAARRPSSVDGLYRVASITKTFTGTAIMQLRDAGKLGLDDPVAHWIPELAATTGAGPVEAVTVRRLLSHESGLISESPGTDWSALPPAYEGLFERGLARAGEIFTAVPPNTQVKYSNLGYQLLGEIVQRVSGVGYPQYVRERILAPLGLVGTTFDPAADGLASRCATGYTGRAFTDELTVAPQVTEISADGGLWSSVPDLARWVSFQLAAHAEAHPEATGQEAASPAATQSPADQRAQSGEVLAAATRREMHKPRYLVDDEWRSALGVSWFGTRDDEVIWFGHSGSLHGFISAICFDPKARVGSVVLLNGEASAPDLARRLGGIARRLVQASPPLVTLPMPTPEEYRALLGLYATADMSGVVRLEWRDGKLVFVDPEEPTYRIVLEPSGEKDAFTVAPGVRASGEMARFRRLPTGAVASVFVGGGTLLRLDPVR